MVLTDDFYPGWTATVDGHPVPIQRVDYLLRGISIGPGQHTIVMRYTPASWTIGWIISLICLLGLGARWRWGSGSSDAAGPTAEPSPAPRFGDPGAGRGMSRPRLQDGYTPQPLVARTHDAIHRRGLRPVTGELVRWAGRVAGGLPLTVTGHHGEFELQGRSYPYLYHRYKQSWLSERAVEVPVAQALVDDAAGERVLEVGHVLGHFRPGQTHTVVDKYEPAPGVLNRDVLDLRELGSFDLIVAISTLEHVGWDEAPRDPGKAIEAVRALAAQLAPGGRLAITVPVGYNPAFDAAIGGGVLASCSSAAALRRQPGATNWREVPAAEVWSAPYDFLLYSARGVVFAYIDAR